MADYRPIDLEVKVIIDHDRYTDLLNKEIEFERGEFQASKRFVDRCNTLERAINETFFVSQEDYLQCSRSYYFHKQALSKLPLLKRLVARWILKYNL